MYLLYIDGSGSVKNPDEAYFILAGVAIFERVVYHLIKDLDDIVDSFGIGSAADIELHASQMLRGRGFPWKGVPKSSRVEMMNRGLQALITSHPSTRAFGVAVHKKSRNPDDPVEYAFEEICNRFNLFLARLYREGGKTEEATHRGLIVMDESQYEEPLQKLARSFRLIGTRWGHLRNMAEVPFFVDSKASRLVQLADLVAFALWRRYEQQDTRFFDPIIPRFDRDGGVLHGLVHYHPKNEECYCPACMSRSI